VCLFVVIANRQEMLIGNDEVVQMRTLALIIMYRVTTINVHVFLRHFFLIVDLYALYF
jgi:hypothetical protein